MRESGRFVQRAMRADTPWWPRCGNHVSDTGLEGSAEACFLRAATGGLDRRSHAAGRRVPGVALVTISTDGYVGVDGAAGWAFVARGPDRAATSLRGALPTCPSHLAEWTAVRRALEWAEETLEDGDRLELRTDSALVAKGLASRRPLMTGEAADVRAECRKALARLASRGIRAKVTRVDRAENAEADAQAREAAGEA